MRTTFVDHASEEILNFAREVFDSAVPPDFQDDRFEASWLEKPEKHYAILVSEIHTDGAEKPVAYIGGHLQNNTLQAEALVTETTTPTIAPSTILFESYRYLISSLPSSVTDIELWCRPIFDFHNEAALNIGLKEKRRIHQLSLSLRNKKVEPQDLLSTTAFSDADLDALLAVNNAAFRNHPDQGSLTESKFADLSKQEWFRKEDIRLYKEGGKLIGFCWNKIHAYPQKRMGEIYVLAVDPKEQAKGIGKKLLLGGMNELKKNQIDQCFLYVEDDNVSANKVYKRLGFQHHHSDVAFSDSK